MFDESQEREPELSSDQLRAQLAAAEERVQRSESDLGRERTRLDSFLSQNQSPAQAAPAAREPIPPMPDPIENPDGYRQWMVQRDARAQQEMESRLEATRAELRGEIEVAESRANLWTAFQSRYPKHAERKDLAGAAYQSLNASGNIPNDVDSIVTAIKSEMDRMVGGSIENFSRPADRSAGTSAGDRPAPPQSKDQGGDDENVTIHSAVSAWKQKYGLI